MLKKVGKIIRTLFFIELSWVFSTYFMYCQNIMEVSIVDTFRPAMWLSICAIVVVAMAVTTFRDVKLIEIYGILVGLFLTNFMYILKFMQKISGSIRYWHGIYIIAVLCVLLLVLLRKTRKFSKELSAVLEITLVGLFLINAITAVPQKIMADMSSRNSSIDVQHASDLASINGNSSNIYFLLCDEYASFDQLKTDFNFDNSEFRSELEKMGFYFTDSSYNEASATSVVMANAMSLDYVASANDSAEQLSEITRNGYLHSFLIENGYEEMGIGYTSWLGFSGDIEKETKATTVDGSSFEEMLMGTTFLAPFFVKDYNIEAQEIANSFESIKSFNIVPDDAKFVMYYVSCPHLPYYFKEDGSMNLPSKYYNSDGTNNDSYLGQVKYVNKNMIVAVKRIVEKDPNSIVIICSDHGNRFGNISDPMFVKKIMCGVYYKGEQYSKIEGMPIVNILRTILSDETGVDLPIVKMPE